MKVGLILENNSFSVKPIIQSDSQGPSLGGQNFVEFWVLILIA